MLGAAYILSVMEMLIRKAVDRGGGVFKALLILSAAVAMTLSSESCKEGVESGIELCLRVLIPSLFPFTALSALAVKCGVCGLLGKKLGGITRRLFGLSGVLAPVIILSLIGGYPVGAKGISELKSSGAIDERQARRAAMFAVCAGPGFLINYVGGSLYGSANVGMVILLAQVISVIVIGIALNIFDRDKSDYNSVQEIYVSPLPFSTALVESAYSAVRAMANICALVLIFSAATGIISGIIPGTKALDLWKILTEVCSAVKLTTERYPLEVTAFAVGFGGLCVHFQIFSALGDIKINKLLFFFIRTIQGLLTALLTRLFSLVFIKETAVFSSGEVHSAGVFGGSIISAVALTAVSICFLITLKNYRR